LIVFKLNRNGVSPVPAFPNWEVCRNTSKPVIARNPKGDEAICKSQSCMHPDCFTPVKRGIRNDIQGAFSTLPGVSE